MSAVQRLSLSGDGPSRRSYEVLTVTKRARAGGFAEQGPGEGRFVRVVLTGTEGERVVDEHLRAGLHAPLRVRRLADVLVGCGGDGSRPRGVCAECTGPASTLLHPGALVVAVPRTAHCVVRYGTDADDAAGAASPHSSGIGGVLTLGGAHRALASWEVWASLAHAWLVAGPPMEEFGTLWETAHRSS